VTPGTWRTEAPAKVNLGLQVASRRRDGYHELRSVFLRLELADTLLIQQTDGPDHLTVEGDPDCPIDGNLALAALHGFRDVAGGHLVTSVTLTLRKRIPLAAGLAGGSSDAAAVLRLLVRRHPAAVDDTAVWSLARTLGADVPFFLSAAGAALVAGIGERVEPLPPPIESLGVLLARPSFGVTTARAFGAWDALHPDGHGSPGGADVVGRLAAELRAGAPPTTIVGLAPLLRDANDLWPATVAVEPRMAPFRAALEERLERPVLMTGSGSTLFALYADADAAAVAARHLAAVMPAGSEDAWITASASGTPYPPDVVIEEEQA
jgi:4-diphosphocytidyl-2-C-methyl-D-erythritol kinase